MQVRVLAFAAVREVLERSELVLELPDGARVADAWDALVRDFPGLHDVEASTRIARNARVAAGEVRLADGDELALLPPLGGG